MMKFFEKLPEIATRIKNPYSLTALAFVLIHFSLYFVSDIPPGAKPWLLSAPLVAAVFIALILRPSPAERAVSVPEENATEPKEFLGLRRLIDSSSLPMYLTDKNLTVLHCNDCLASLVETSVSTIVGKHLTEVVGFFGNRVPKNRRARFLKDQQALINKTMLHLSPHAERIEYIDNRDLPGNPYYGLHKVWIHADKVRSAKADQDIGVFVVYQVKAVKEVPPPANDEASE